MTGVRGLPDGSVRTVVTSPPYFRQRDYGYQGQWGQEVSPVEYVGHLAELFTELHRVLKDDGTVWMVLGDSYASTTRGGQAGRRQYGQDYGQAPGLYPGIKKKDLMGVPWMVAFALRQQGWYLRQDVIWFKSNPMPESVKDRCTRSHEYIFMFSKNERYYYDHLAIATPISDSTQIRMRQDVSKQKGIEPRLGKGQRADESRIHCWQQQEGHGRRHDGFNERRAELRESANGCEPEECLVHCYGHDGRKSIMPVFPAAIPRLCIKAATKEGDIVLDPFAGTGTTLLEASMLGRKYMGFDLSEKYVVIANRRLKKLEGIFYRE